MSYDNYFVGPPVEAVKLAAAPGANHGPQVTAGEQKPVSTTRAPGTHNYFVGTPLIPEGKQLPAPAPAPPPPPPPPRKKNGSLAKCFTCLFGGGADER